MTQQIAEHYDGTVNSLNQKLATPETSPYIGGLLFPDQLADELYVGNGYAANIIDRLPEEATRRGWKVAVKDTKEADPFADPMDTLGVVSLFSRADKMARKDGAASLLMITSGDTALNTELVPTQVTKIERLLLIEKRSLQPGIVVGDINSPLYGQPADYGLIPVGATGAAAGMTRIHPSRLLMFTGVWLPPTLRQLNAGWPASILGRVYEKIIDLTETDRAIRQIIKRFSQAIYSGEGLTGQLVGANGQKVQEHIETLRQSLDNGSLLALDKDREALTYLTASVAGLADLYDRKAQALAAVANMPVTLLLSQSPGGLSTDDASGRTYWYDKTRNHQTTDYKPLLERLVRVLACSKKGPTKGIEPEEWSIQFAPLEEASEEKRAGVFKTKVEAFKGLWELNAITEEQISKAFTDPNSGAVVY